MRPLFYWIRQLGSIMAFDGPLLFEIKEDTYSKAFLYASVVVGLTTGLTFEYRLKDPLNLYDHNYASTEGKDTSTWNVMQTSIASGLFTFLTLWVLRVLFGLGSPWVVP